MMITVIGRGHSGTRAMSHTLQKSGVYMGARLNPSGDLVPAEDLYEACRVFAKYVVHEGENRWDFSQVLAMDPDPAFSRLVESYLASVLGSTAGLKGWKLPETTLVYPWIVRMFPDIRYIHWVRDPRDCILGGHLTDDLADFGVDYVRTDDVYLRRATSWLYQQQIVRATPRPRHCRLVRFEDLVLEQETTLAGLEEFLGFDLTRIEVRPEVIGRYLRTDVGFDFSVFSDDLRRLEYEENSE